MVLANSIRCVQVFAGMVSKWVRVLSDCCIAALNPSAWGCALGSCAVALAGLEEVSGALGDDWELAPPSEVQG